MMHMPIALSLGALYAVSYGLRTIAEACEDNRRVGSRMLSATAGIAGFWVAFTLGATAWCGL